MTTRLAVSCLLLMLATSCISTRPALAQAPTEPSSGAVADKPLFRDPVHDGAADPVLVYQRAEERWLMFYTNRRANVAGLSGVTWVHGTEIGIAESTDGGATWQYRGTAQIDIDPDGEYSYWAPDVLYHDGTYHMYLTYVPGIYEDWGHPRDIVHLTSDDAIHWTEQSRLDLASERVIDATVFQMQDGTWRMWYNNEADAKSIYYADSPDLYTWTDRGKATGDQPGEGPVVFEWRGSYWMVVDLWEGLGVYRSDDLETWTRQPGTLLGEPGTGLDDQVVGRHPGIALAGDRAFLFYFTHPGHFFAPDDLHGYANRRTSIQVAELQLEDGRLITDRDAPTRIDLQTPSAGARTR